MPAYQPPAIPSLYSWPVLHRSLLFGFRNTPLFKNRAIRALVLSFGSVLHIGLSCAFFLTGLYGFLHFTEAKEILTDLVSSSRLHGK